MNRRELLPLVLLLALAGCETGGVEPPITQKTSLGKVAAGTLSVELLTDTRLETGLTPICLKVTTAAGEPVTDAEVAFTPMMQMADGNHHSAPMIGPPALDSIDGCYKLHVIFQMFTGPAGSWSATVKVTRDGVTSEGSFPSLVIADSGRARTFLAPDQTKYVVSLNYKAAFKVGLNPILVTVHTKKDALTFPAVEDAVLGLDPQMPSMGHGSPGSLDPTHTSQGRYEGQLSFSMPGDWETTVTVRRNGVVQGAPKFRVDF